jgi:hypothetical protein
MLHGAHGSALAVREEMRQPDGDVGGIKDFLGGLAFLRYS